MKRLLPFLLISLAHPQVFTPIAPKKGARTVGFSIDWFRNGSGGTATSLFLTPGYFVADNLEIRVPFSYDRLFGITETIYGIGARLHFPNRRHPQFDPFLGGIVERAAAPRFREDFVGVQVGLHVFLARDFALTTQLTVGRDRANGVSQTTRHLTSGFSVFFAGF